MDNGGNPYSETITQGTKTRTFSCLTPSEELVWHRDECNRVVCVESGNGWQFQLDNQLPETIKIGDVISIPANVYHRIIPGLDDLVVTITEEEIIMDKEIQELLKLAGIGHLPVEYNKDGEDSPFTAYTLEDGVEEDFLKPKGGEYMDDESIEENAFNTARDEAIAAGKNSFEFEGETYPVTDVDPSDRERAKSRFSEAEDDGEYFDKVLDAIAALYGPGIWDNDAMQDLADDLEQAGPTDQELDFIIAKGKLPKRLANTQFSAGDNVQFGEGKRAKSIFSEAEDDGDVNQFINNNSANFESEYDDDWEAAEKNFIEQIKSAGHSVSDINSEADPVIVFMDENNNFVAWYDFENGTGFIESSLSEQTMREDDMVYNIEDEDVSEAKSDSFKRKFNKAMSWDHSDPKKMMDRIRSYSDDDLLDLYHHPDEAGDGSARSLQLKLITRELKRRFGVSPSGQTMSENESDFGMDDEEQDVMIKFESEEAHDLIDELFGALADRGIEGEIILPPRVRGAVEQALRDGGFTDGEDYQFVNPMTEVDLQNGYDQHYSVDGEDYFPDGDTGPAPRKLGPGAAKQGDNPLATRMNVKESESLYEQYATEFKRFKDKNK